MNYVVEGGLDFWGELAKQESGDEENRCLLSDEPLTLNHISLKCGHSFNYVFLFEELRREKTRYNSKEVQRVAINQIKCPYCRQLHTGLLPYVPILKKEKIRGVNAPKPMSMVTCRCEWTISAGKRKGFACGSAAFQTDTGARCEKHWRIEQTTKNTETEWTAEMEDLMRRSKQTKLAELLRAKHLPTYGTKKMMVRRLFANDKS
jgi:hypothetical protein